MFSKPLAVAALVGGASAFDTLTITYATTLTCGPCILGGYNFCTAKATMSYYSKLSAAYTRDDNTSVCCNVGTTACTNAASVTVNNSADWTCYNLPTATTATNAYSFTAKSLELAACPFEETVCGTTREFSYTAVGDTGTVTLTALAAGSVCSYVIKTSAGAPNFEIDSTTTVDNDKAQIAWLEYDKDEITTWQAAGSGAGGVTGFPATTFPINTQTVSFLSTCTSCTQGSLIKRSYDQTTDGTTTTIDVTAQTIIDQYVLQKNYYDSYADLCITAQEANDSIVEPSWFDALFGAVAEERTTVDPLAADTIVYTWNNTGSQGGYGAPTAGYYSLATKGQKPYGAEGQGGDLDKNIALDMNAQDRFMIVQVLPYSNYTQATNNEVFKMTVGAYAFVDSNNFIQPTRGSDCVLTGGASMVQVSMGVAAAALVALSLY